MKNSLNLRKKIFLSPVQIYWNERVFLRWEHILFEVDENRMVSFSVFERIDKNTSIIVTEAIIKPSSIDPLVSFLYQDPRNNEGSKEIDMSYLLLDEEYFPSTSADVDTVVLLETSNSYKPKKIIPKVNTTNQDQLKIVLCGDTRYCLLRKIQQKFLTPTK